VNPAFYFNDTLPIAFLAKLLDDFSLTVACAAGCDAYKLPERRSSHVLFLARAAAGAARFLLCPGFRTVASAGGAYLRVRHVNVRINAGCRILKRDFKVNP